MTCGIDFFSLLLSFAGLRASASPRFRLRGVPGYYACVHNVPFASLYYPQALRPLRGRQKGAEWAFHLLSKDRYGPSAGISISTIEF